MISVPSDRSLTLSGKGLPCEQDHRSEPGAFEIGSSSWVLSYQILLGELASHRIVKLTLQLSLERGPFYNLGLFGQ